MFQKLRRTFPYMKSVNILNSIGLVLSIFLFGISICYAFVFYNLKALDSYVSLNSQIGLICVSFALITMLVVFSAQHLRMHDKPSLQSYFTAGFHFLVILLAVCIIAVPYRNYTMYFVTYSLVSAILSTMQLKNTIFRK